MFGKGSICKICCQHLHNCATLEGQDLLCVPMASIAYQLLIWKICMQSYCCCILISFSERLSQELEREKEMHETSKFIYLNRSLCKAAAEMAIAWLHEKRWKCLGIDDHLRRPPLPLGRTCQAYRAKYLPSQRPDYFRGANAKREPQGRRQPYWEKNKIFRERK